MSGSVFSRWHYDFFILVWAHIKCLLLAEQRPLLGAVLFDSNFSLFSYLKCIVHFDSKISDGALQLCVTK